MFEYGEELCKKCYWPRPMRKIGYRFRMDPVPFIGRGHGGFYAWYKSPKMRKRELSLYEEHRKFVRARRKPKYMPDPWDDCPRGDVDSRRSWKNRKIRKQWMKNMPV
jgi:hypothetical protein